MLSTLRNIPKMTLQTTAKVRYLSKLTGVELVSPSIGLNEDATTFYELARSFADNELKPYAQEWDETATFPVNTFKKFAELGFAGMCGVYVCVLL